MRTAISKKWTFDSAHRLPNHDGKCAREHGHTYTLEVRVAGEPQAVDGRPDEGMVCDFAMLDRVWAKLKPTVDHQHLNKTVEGEGYVERTTSELLAAWFYKEFKRHLDAAAEGAVTVERVRVSETANTYAEVPA